MGATDYRIETQTLAVPSILLTKSLLTGLGAILESGKGHTDYSLEGVDKNIRGYKVAVIIDSRWPKKPRSFNASYEHSDPNTFQKIKIQILFGEKAADSNVVIESSDSKWLNGTSKQFEDIFTDARINRSWVGYQVLRFFVAFALSFPFSLAFATLAIDLGGATPPPGIQGRLALTSFISFFAGAFANENVALLWPYNEIEGSTPYQRTRWVLTFFMVALVGGVIYDLYRLSILP